MPRLDANEIRLRLSPYTKIWRVREVQADAWAVSGAVGNGAAAQVVKDDRVVLEQRILQHQAPLDHGCRKSLGHQQPGRVETPHRRWLVARKLDGMRRALLPVRQRPAKRGVEAEARWHLPVTQVPDQRRHR